MGDVWNVLHVGVFEAQAMQGLEQVGGGADALDGGFEDVFGLAWVSMSSVGVSVTLLLRGR